MALCEMMKVASTSRSPGVGPLAPRLPQLKWLVHLLVEAQMSRIKTGSDQTWLVNSAAELPKQTLHMSSYPRVSELISCSRQ